MAKPSHKTIDHPVASEEMIEKMWTNATICDKGTPTRIVRIEQVHLVRDIENRTLQETAAMDLVTRFPQWDSLRMKRVGFLVF